MTTYNQQLVIIGKLLYKRKIVPQEDWCSQRLLETYYRINQMKFMKLYFCATLNYMEINKNEPGPVIEMGERATDITSNNSTNGNLEKNQQDYTRNRIEPILWYTHNLE